MNYLRMRLPRGYLLSARLPAVSNVARRVRRMGLPLRKSKVAIPPPQCPIALCMELLRGAWAPHVLWYLRAGPRRFGELRHDIPRISARVLSARLREMEFRGMISRRLIDTSPPSAEYELTQL